MSDVREKHIQALRSVTAATIDLLSLIRELIDCGASHAGAGLHLAAAARDAVDTLRGIRDDLEKRMNLY